MRGKEDPNKPKPTRRQRRSGLIVNVLTLVLLVLVVFEGKSLLHLFSNQPIQDRIREEEAEVFQSANLLAQKGETESDAQERASDLTDATEGSERESERQTEQPSEAQTEEPLGPAQTGRENGIPEGGEDYMDIVVPEQSVALEDSYFSDAVFIGDSRMEGFRNFSGITKGSFVTAIGMQLENIYTDAQIATSRGNMLVLDALKNINYTKIYMMLGTNELGAYDMTKIKDAYSKVLTDVKTYSSSTEPVVYVYPVD